MHDAAVDSVGKRHTAVIQVFGKLPVIRFIRCGCSIDTQADGKQERRDPDNMAFHLRNAAFFPCSLYLLCKPDKQHQADQGKRLLADCSAACSFGNAVNQHGGSRCSPDPDIPVHQDPCQKRCGRNARDPDDPEIIRQVRSEALEAHKLLGIKETAFLELPAPALDQYPRYKIANEIASVIRKFNIEVLFIPHRGDCHKDHTIIHECSMVACRPLGNSIVKDVYAYETLSETEWGEPVSSDYFVPTKYVTFTEKEFSMKLEAMGCFKSQLYEFPASRSLKAIEALAMYRGATVSRMRAECFEVLREID